MESSESALFFHSISGLVELITSLVLGLWMSGELGSVALVATVTVLVLDELPIES